MPIRTATVVAQVGLHARPAATFTRAAAASGLPVTIGVDGRPPVDATSVLSVMTLGVAHGQEVTLHAEGDGADAVLDGLVELLATDPEA